jgi:hypothetical protein
MSVPPDSPVTPSHSTAWGAPPPVPAHALGTEGSRPPLHPLFIPSASDMPTPMGSEMALGDLIHLDDEALSPDATRGSAPATPTSGLERPPLSGLPSAVFKPDPSMSLATATPLEPSTTSPLLGEGSPTSAANFNLSSLWGGQDGPSGSHSPVNAPISEPATEPPRASEEDQADMDIDDDSDDHALDMFLRDEDGPPPTPAQAEEPAESMTPPPKVLPLESKTSVWTGSVSYGLLRLWLPI